MKFIKNDMEVGMKRVLTAILLVGITKSVLAGVIPKAPSICAVLACML